MMRQYGKRWRADWRGNDARGEPVKLTSVSHSPASAWQTLIEMVATVGRNKRNLPPSQGG